MPSRRCSVLFLCYFDNLKEAILRETVLCDDCVRVQMRQVCTHISHMVAEKSKTFVVVVAAFETVRAPFTFIKVFVCEYKVQFPFSLHGYISLI